jgi:ParB-like chromosome segregation protein Spo0J
MRIVAGHVRLQAAKNLGLKKVPTIVLDLDEQDLTMFGIAENKTSELAIWDRRKLKELISELRAEDVNLDALGFSKVEFRRVLGNQDESSLVA